MTYGEMNKEIERILNEGHDVTMTNGEKTWTMKGRKTKTETTDERDAETVDVQMTVTDERTTLTEEQMTTTTVDVQVEATEGQVTEEQMTVTVTDVQMPVTEGQMTVTDGQTVTTDDVEKEEMVIGVDPGVCSLSASTPEPMPGTSGMSCGDFAISQHPAVDSSIAAPAPSRDEEYELQKVDNDSDKESVGRSASGIAKRVAGRKRVVVVDDESDTTTMSIMSVTSADEDSSMAASSSRAVNSKGLKRRRETGKGKGRAEERSSSEEKKKKKRGKKKEVRKDTPEQEEKVGVHGEPKGVVAHVLEDMSSPVLGGAIQEWADSIEDIRAKSRNIQGRLSGELKRHVARIKEGAALLVVRLDATGDPQFLRMRNTELVARLREMENENSRLKEMLRKKSPGVPSSPRRKKVEKTAVVDTVPVVLDDSVESAAREEFPPLPQRPPRIREVQDGGTKVGPRIVSDVQVVAPRKERRSEVATASVATGSETEWRVATGKRKGRIKGDKPPRPRPPPPHPPPDPGAGRPAVRQQQQRPRIRLPKPPSSTAVTITGRSEGFSYADAMRNAREHIDLEKLGIKTSRVRKALNGGLLIEVTGEDVRTKAGELVTRLRNVFKDSAAVACPVKKRELSVVGFDESVTSREVVEALSCVGGCPSADIRTGPIRMMNNGLGMLWVQLPVEAAARAAEEGRLRVGWTMARVELLKVRPLQCFKCWAFGHVQNMCKSVVDRRGACFRCGQGGHVAGVCKNPVHCAVCFDAGLEAAHRLGGPQCAATESRGQK